MSTHAAIITKEDGIYVGCYVHFDGYPTGVGQVLLSDFNAADAVSKLVKMGMVESIKVGGFITKWEDPSVATPKFGATIEDVANVMSSFHVYVFEKGKWTYDKIPITGGRRSKKWKFKGKPLEISIGLYREQLAKENASR